MERHTFKLGDECLSCHKSFLKEVVYGMPTLEVFNNKMFIMDTPTTDKPELGCQNCGAVYWSDGRQEFRELPI